MRLTAVSAAGALIVAGCAPDEPGVAESTELPEPTEDTGEAPEEDVEPPEQPTEPATEDDEPVEAEEPTGADEAAQEEPDDGTEPLEGEASMEASDEGEIGDVAVTDVRLATHEGYDRVVFEIEGDGTAGWDLRYVDEATSQGSGELIEVEGSAVLAISLQNVTLPPDLPDEIERWDEDRLDGPAGGVVIEVVNDTIFEGIQTLFAGIDQERAFIVERFEDPQRIVIDIMHDE